jgi:hypothetical protein
MNEFEQQLPDGLDEVARQLRTRRHAPDAMELDELKRRAMAKATRAAGSRQGKGTYLRSRLVTIMLVAGLTIGGGAAGVIAAKGGSPPPSAGNGQYCNSGNGNGSETPTTPPPGTTECDPGNSPTNNNDQTKENTAPPTTLTGPKPKPGR